MPSKKQDDNASDGYYQDAAAELTLSFLSNLQKITEELERNNGDFEKLKSESKFMLKRLESVLPKNLKANIPVRQAKIIQENQRVKDIDVKARSKTVDKAKSDLFANELLKIFLPDAWAVKIIKADTEKQSSASPSASTLKGEIRHQSLVEKGLDRLKNLFKAPSSDSGSTSSSTEAAITKKRSEPEAHHSPNIDRAQSYKSASKELTSIYHYRIAAIKKALDKANGNLDILSPEIKKEISTLQTILPQTQLKLLNNYLDPGQKGKEISKELEASHMIVAKKMAQIVGDNTFKGFDTVSKTDLKALLQMSKPQNVSITEISSSHLKEIPNVTKKDTKAVDLSSYYSPNRGQSDGS